jgi:hypothetical protein
MKKALVFFFAVVIGLCFSFTGFAQESTTSGPAKEGKQLTKGKYVKTKKTQQTGGASTAQQPTQAATPAKPATPSKPTASSSSTAPTKVQNGTVGPGSAEGKKLTKGKYTKTKSTGGAPAAQ